MGVKAKRPLSPKTTGDDHLCHFLPEQYSAGINPLLVVQHTAMLSAQVVTLVTRHRKNFFREAGRPGSEPWFLLKISTRFVAKSGFFGCHTSGWEALIATNGEVFFPVRAGVECVARISRANYGSIDWNCFGPSDKELVRQAITAYLASL